MGLFRVLKFEAAKAFHQRLVQVALPVCALTVLGGGYLAMKRYGIQAETGASGFTVLEEGANLGLGVALIFLLIHASASVAGERNSGTMKYCLTAGVRRSVYFSGKIIMEVLLAVFLMMVIMGAALAWGWVLKDYTHNVGEEMQRITPEFMWGLSVRFFVSVIGLGLSLPAAVLFMSSVMKSATSVMGLAIGVLVVGTVVANFWAPFEGFWPIHYYNDSQKMLLEYSLGSQGQQLMDWGALQWAVVLNLIYFAVFSTGVILVGARRDVVAE